MRTLFIDPPGGWQKQGYNLGFCLLAAVLERKQHPSRILDLNQDEASLSELDNFISSFDPEVIGISVKSASYNSAQALAQSLKNRYPQRLIIAGGPHVSLHPLNFLKEIKEIDIAFSGEAEDNIARLAEAGRDQADLGSVSGIYFNHRDYSSFSNPVIADLDSLPFPRLESYVRLHPARKPYHLLTGRGCPFTCTYCSVHLTSGRKIRHRSIESLMAELRRAKQEYGITVFEVDDDNFTLDLGRAKSFCTELLRREISLPWFLPNGIRPSLIDAELARLLVKSGCDNVSLGIESADPLVLKTVKKGHTPDEIRSAVEILKAAGIRVMGFYILGLPGSSFAADARTIEFDRELGLHDRIYNSFVPYPGTAAWEWCQKNGRFLTDYRNSYHFLEHNRFAFVTEDYPLPERNLAFALTRMSSRGISSSTFDFLKRTFSPPHPGPALLIEIQSYRPDIGELFQSLPELDTVQILDLKDKKIRLLPPPSGSSGVVDFNGSGIGSRVKLALGLLRILPSRKYRLLILPQVNIYLIASLLIRSDQRCVYSYQSEFREISSGEIIFRSIPQFILERFIGGKSAPGKPAIPEAKLSRRKSKISRRPGQSFEKIRKIKSLAISWSRHYLNRDSLATLLVILYFSAKILLLRFQRFHPNK